MSGSTGGGSMSKYGGCGSDCSNMSDAFNACGFPSP
jgi:hypothetical protein